MGRAPCCDKANVKKGPWSPEEDAKLKSYIEEHGTGGNWIALPQKIGLKRCGKSCRLRWLNYLRPNIKHGGFSDEEDNIICRLYIAIGSRWSIIAAQLPGRTDNDIKNYWNTKLKKQLLGKPRTDHNQSRRTLNLGPKKAVKEIEGSTQLVANQGNPNAFLPEPIMPVYQTDQLVDCNASNSLRSLLKFGIPSQLPQLVYDDYVNIMASSIHANSFPDQGYSFSHEIQAGIDQQLQGLDSLTSVPESLIWSEDCQSLVYSPVAPTYQVTASIPCGNML